MINQAMLPKETVIIIPTKCDSDSDFSIRLLLEDIKKYTSMPFHLIIVNDCSTSEVYSEYLKSLSEDEFFKDRLTLIKTDKNIGPGVARNIAIKKALSLEWNVQYFTFLDDDVRIIGDDWLYILKRSIEQNFNVGIVGPIQNNVQELGFKYVSTACCMVRRFVFEKHVLFDEKLTPLNGMFGGEEFDFMWQAKLAGFDINTVGIPICHYCKQHDDKRVPIENANIYVRNKWKDHFRADIDELTKLSEYDTTWTPYPFTEEQFNTNGIKLHLGPNDTYLNDFINVDIDNPIADVNCDASNLSMFRDNTVSLILASHLIEHFSNVDAEKALREWNRVLKPNHWLVMELPDMEKCFKLYLDSQDLNVKKDAAIGIWGRFDWTIWQGHRYGYCKDTMKDLLQRTGFKDITFLEPLDSSAKNRSMRVDARKG